MSTASVLIIGNEILSGRIRDENAWWLARRCRELGIDLVRVVFIPDDIGIIAHTVRTTAEGVDHLFTSGGVGPTHDDLTMEGVAAAFGVPLRRDPVLVELIRTKLGPRWREAADRMADLPEGAELWWDGEIHFPLVVKRNVAIFPGVPDLLRRKFDSVAHRFERGRTVFTRTLEVVEQEVTIAAGMAEIQRRWPQVCIGSYPQFERRPWSVTVVIESREQGAVEACEAELRATLGLPT